MRVSQQPSETLLVGVFNALQRRSKRWLPDYLTIHGGLHWGFVKGTAGNKTPTSELALQPGELVRIRGKEDIMGTLNANLLNRGMGFEEEMARYCGRTVRVIGASTAASMRRPARCDHEESVHCFGGRCLRRCIPF
jgi:hypothetical protein